MKQMKFINPPKLPPAGVIHATFYSKLFGQEVGYNIFLPPGYGKSGQTNPVVYHLHGWTDNESSGLRPLRKVYKSRQAITVFPNNSPVIEGFEDLPVEAVLIDELIPHIDREYRTDAARESRSISGFSMGGGMAFVFAVRHLDLFSAVTAYAGTYHHYYPRDYQTVGVEREKAAGIYEEMIRDGRHLEEDNVLCLIREHAAKIRENLNIGLHVGTNDILLCDNEILHLHLESLHIPHEYKVIDGAAHRLKKIL